MDETKFFELTRAQIEHEDGLLHNRLTWLLTLQGLLFSAYGFSLSAEATVVAVTKQTLTPGALDVIGDISIARTWMSIVGFIAALLLFAGVAAASKSMFNLVRNWESFGRYTTGRYPQIIGRPFGSIHIGLLPTYILPLIFAIAWIGLVHNIFLEYIFFVLILITAVAGISWVIAVQIVRNKWM